MLLAGITAASVVVSWANARCMMRGDALQASERTLLTALNRSHDDPRLEFVAHDLEQGVVFVNPDGLVLYSGP